MLKILISGCNGRMGQVLTKIIEERDNMQIVAGLARNAILLNNYPVFSSPDKCNVEADVIIDFSNHSLIPSLVRYSVERKTPIIIGTTALDEECQNALNLAAVTIPVFQSANMSLGINALVKVINEIGSSSIIRYLKNDCHNFYSYNLFYK